MKVYSTEQIKNIVLLGNTGSGKTTLSEAMIFNGGIIDRRGDTDSKNTASDYSPIEQQNKSSVFASVLYTEFNEKKINFIDVPGLDDFVNGTIAGLTVADAALLVINAQNGVEVGAELHYRHSEKFAKPLVIAINQLDNEKANFEATVESIKERIGGNATLIQFPVNAGAGFTSVVDILTMKLYKYASDSGKPEITDIPAEYMERVTELRTILVEKAAENDEGLMEIFFANDSLSEDEMRAGISAGLIQRGLFPIFCVSGKKNVGVSRMMEFLTRVAPAPNKIPSKIKTSEGKTVECDPKQPASMYVFKTSIETHIGEINFFRVMSGEVTEAMDVVNVNTGAKERLSQLFAVAGKNRNKVEKLVAGDIGATVKLKNTRTSHTLAAPSVGWTFEPIAFPDPKFRTAIKAVNESDEEKLNEALQRMIKEDPTIHIEHSKELKQTILSGQGEYHLNIVKWHLDNIYKIATEYLKPRIPYRETITKMALADYRHKKQSGGAGQFGEVHIIIEPFHEDAPEQTMLKIEGKEIKLSIRDKEEHVLPWGGKLVFYSCIVGGSIDARFLPAILKGIMEKMEEGPLTGSYARDIRVYVYDGKMHPVDSNEISFRLAGRNAFKEAFKKAGPKILEPIYQVDVWVPADRMGDVMSDMQGRRAIVQGMTSERGFEKITAKVPLSEMDKYSTSLSSLTGGRAMYTMKLSEYSLVPPDVQENLIKGYEGQEKEE